MAWDRPCTQPLVKRKEEQDPAHTTSKNHPALKFCVSSHRCKHVSCYIRAALHLSSHSHTPTNYPPGDTQIHLPAHILSPHPRANSPTLAHTPGQPPAAPSSCSPQVSRAFEEMHSFQAQRKFGSPLHSCLHTIWYLTLFIVITYLHIAPDRKSQAERGVWHFTSIVLWLQQPAWCWVGRTCVLDVLVTSPGPFFWWTKRATCPLTLLPLERAV